MPTNTPLPNPEDPRWQSILETMRRHGFASEALIETLHSVQSAFGYLSLDALQFVGTSLHVPLSRVYGVATFYHLFTLTPPAQHTCIVCTGTACHIKGAAGILEAAEQALDLQPGQTTEDGSVSLGVVRCIGSCGPAPLVLFDDEIVGYLTPEVTLKRIRSWKSHVNK